jgi:hypothetical protein
VIAKFKGKCFYCGKAIEAGQDISWSRLERGKAWHTGCYAASHPASVPTSVPHAVIPPPVSLSETDLLAVMKRLVSELPKTDPADTPELPFTSAVPTAIPTPTRKRAAVKLDLNSPWYDVFSGVLPLVDCILLIGPWGTGKSTTAMIEASITNRITMTETTSKEDLIGMYHLIDGETRWVDGVATVAMRCGQPMLIDEPDRYSPECASLFYSLIDDKPHTCLPSGEIVNAIEGYKVIMASNESLETLPMAVQDRIEVIIMALTPHEDSMAELSDAMRQVVTRYYGTLAYARPKLFPTVRRMKAFHKLITGGIPNDLAASLVFGSSGPEILSTLTSAEVK